jgi:hypothetical protein
LSLPSGPGPRQPKFHCGESHCSLTAFHSGFKSADQVQQLVADAVRWVFAANQDPPPDGQVPEFFTNADISGQFLRLRVDKTPF